MEVFPGWFVYDAKEKTLSMVFSIFAVTSVYNHGLPNNHDFDEMIDIMVLFYLFV